MNTPSPNPVGVFRWEDSSALEHSCWACPTKSNSPKAIHTCYGIHSIPCIAYHSTMHAVGTSHRCSGCVASREVHETRHREIAELVAEYNAPEFMLSPVPVRARRRTLGERPANMAIRNLPRLERGDADDADSEDNENENDNGFDGTSTTASSDGGSPKLLKLSKAEKRELKKATKLEKSRSKAAKNEARFGALVTTEDVKKVERVLHGEKSEEEDAQRHPLATDQTIEDVISRNLGFVKQIESHKRDLYESIRTGRQEEQQRKRDKKRINDGGEDVELEAVIDAILVKLGVTVGSDAGKKHKTPNKAKNCSATPNHKSTPAGPKAKIVQKLRDAIKDDLEKHENDLRQTYIRAGGFFRYAGRSVFERMTEIARNIDLQTGEDWEKKRKREGSNNENENENENNA